MSIFDSSLEPIKRMRRKARERRLLATREVREMLERRFGGAPNVSDRRSRAPRLPVRLRG